MLAFLKQYLNSQSENKIWDSARQPEYSHQRLDQTSGVTVKWIA